MIKEEWRTHSTLFGGFMFALFPFLIAGFAAIGMASLPIFKNIFPSLQIAMIGQYMFVLFGLSVGSFGLLGREFMNRRFGHASLIAYSSRNLPVSEKEIFTNFIIKDIIFYFILWIIPFNLGIFASTFFLPFETGFVPVLLASTSLSFLIGLSIAFFLSTVYVHSRTALIAMLAAGTAAFILIPNSAFYLPSLSFMLAPSAMSLLVSIAISAGLCIISLEFVKVDYPENKRQYKNSFLSFSNLFSFSRHKEFVAKDFLDLIRSEGGVGKIIFSFFFPLAMIWIMLSIFMRFVPEANPVLMFSIFLGVISSTVYNWLTEFDLFGSYSFLPVKVSDVIKSKIVSYYTINLMSIAILIFAAAYFNGFGQIIQSAVISFSISTYVLSVIIYLTGLHPNIMLYNARVFLQYIIMNSSLLLLFIFISLVNPILTLLSIALIPISIFLMKRSFEKWDKAEQMSF